MNETLDKESIKRPDSPDYPPPTHDYRPPSPDYPPPVSTSPIDPPPKSTSPVESPPEHMVKKDTRPVNSKSDFEAMVEFYLADNPYLKKRGGGVSELEIKFGTNTEVARPLSKIDYDNVVKQFYGAGFTTGQPDGVNYLRINIEDYMDKKTGQYRMGNIRAEIAGLDLIQEYCRTNNLQKLIDLPSTSSAVADKIKFTKKAPPYIGDTRETSKPLQSVEFPDHNFRVSYQYETDYSIRSDTASKMLSKWVDTKKNFRYINRVRLSHPEYPIFVDISIIKSSAKKNKKVFIPQYTVQEARLFTNEESYEVELEIDNSRVGVGTNYKTTAQLMNAIRKCTRIVLSGLQGTSYPIAYSECKKILSQYIQTTRGEEYTKEYIANLFSVKDYIRERAKRSLNKHFIGPSSYTLQLSNIAEIPEDGERLITDPNIRENYTVTDKADGDRKMLYIATNGHMYMIDTNMSVIFTGIITRDKELYDTIMDGEHIKYDKMGKFVNLYAAFDIYILNGKNVRELDFVPMNDVDLPANFRLPLLQDVMRKLKPISILDKDSGNSDPHKKHVPKDGVAQHSCWLTVKCKDFYSTRDGSIFQQCSTILSMVNDGSYEYNTDGLIFTPTSTGVGGERSGHAGPMSKYTWAKSFKWKPPEFNTIDFNVSIKKDKTGKDEIHNVFQDGLNMATSTNITQYKTLVLRSGFNKKTHGYINPMLNVINDQLPTPGNKDDEREYKPVPFQPIDPYDPNASLCNVKLTQNGSGKMVMMTEENEYFEDDMIVEFSYDLTKSGPWRWIPLRVRYDKTNELRSGGTNYGNPYHVASSNWKSIHNPITHKMITTGEDIPTYIGEEVYYNRKGNQNNTPSLRKFHNYIKRKLIGGVSNRGDTLIDYAVGMGGDLAKWTSAKLGFVFGIDLFPDNIENQLNGACARYLNDRGQFVNTPDALFAVGNSKLLIRSGKAGTSERDKQVINAIFGQGPKDKDELGAGVYKHYGVGEHGFNVSSVQFALHYFFESERIMHTFLRNVSECTKLNGYFIGTCYDGQTVFDLLQNKYKGESIMLERNGDKIFEITKQYDHTGFPEDEYSLNYQIDVFQESINKTFPEYLVNFKYLQRVMENYGFTIISKEEANTMGLPNGSGLFDEVFGTVDSDIEQNYRLKNDLKTILNMSKEEKRISFLNRYFVFRKTHNVNAEKAAKLMMVHRDDEDDEDDVDKIIQRTQKEDENMEKTKSETKSVIRKLPGKKTRLTIGRSDPAITEIRMVEPSISTGKKVVIKRQKPKSDA